MPPFLRHKLEGWIRQYKRKRWRQSMLEKLIYDVYTIHPPCIIQNDAIKEQIKIFKEKYEVPLELNTTISKDDIMYLYALRHIESPFFQARLQQFDYFNTNAKANLDFAHDLGYAEKYAATYYFYLSHGLHDMNINRKLINHKFGGMEHINSFLDFGSGYGKLTRFLVLEVDQKKIWVCDIKLSAVQFLIEHFGVNGFLSPEVPEEFPTERKFDVIYAASVFSHLPEELFLRWLTQLYNLTSENGMLVFSVHDINLIGLNTDKGAHYIKSNEDESFPEIAGRIKGTENYGSMYVNETFVSQQLRKIGVNDNQYRRYQKGLGQLQDLYVITKNDIFDNDNSVDLSTFP